MYKVIQWATGGVGQAAIEGVITHPELELVGCWVHSDAKNGRDVGELIGRAPIGVTATSDVDSILRIDADVRRLRDAGATFRNDIVTGPGGKQILLEDPSGNVVELFEPAAR